jgi:hypothetical protein
MKIVTPDTPTSLLLDLAYMPFGVATAKGAFYVLIKNRGKGLDAYGVPYDWDRMVSGNLALAPDQPVLRSAPKDGKDVCWPIPTIVVASHRFFYKAKRKDSDGLPPLRDVYEYFSGICCFCGQKIRSLAEASREHVHSKAYDGPDHSSNIALAHRSCNSMAGHAMPKLDKDGNEIIGGMKVYASGFVLPRHVPLREEWRPFLFLDHKLDGSNRG